jgi:hypothetical protein
MYAPGPLPLRDRGGAALQVGCNESAVSENINSRPTQISIFPRYKMAVCEKVKPVLDSSRRREGSTRALPFLTPIS